jgi:glucose/arabinose dehydrogenase
MKPRPCRALAGLLVSLFVAPLAAAPAPKLFTEGVRATEPLSPEEQRLKFHLPPGFKIQLVASEPDLRKPMNMAFDSAGRLWVTESREYPFAATNAALARDTIRIFSDFDDNGRARKVTTFATNLNIPIGVYPFRSPGSSRREEAPSNSKPKTPNAKPSQSLLTSAATNLTWKCLAWSIPNIWLFEDTDGDGVADKKEVLYGPFDFTRDTHGNQASFRRGLDGWIYATHGFNNQSRVSGTDGHEIFLPSGNVYRFRLDGSRIEHWTHGQVNPFGLTFDPLGNLYSADCHSSPIYQLLRGAHYPSFGRPHDGLGFAPTTIQHSHHSTAICGITHISDPAWPAEFQGNLFIGNVMTSRINRDQLEWRGSTSVGKEMPDFLSTDDPWFRPVDLQFGPDGALWVADFYNRIIGHYEVPLLHPGRDRERGRIWRIVPPGGADVRRLKLVQDDKVKTPPGVAFSRDALLNEFLSENPTRRALAREELALLPNANEHGLITQAAQGLWHFRARDEREGLMTSCLWLLNRDGKLDDKTLLGVLQDRDEPVRVHALRILTERGLRTAAQRTNPARPASLPLPAGEGRGEGEKIGSPAASPRLSPPAPNRNPNPAPSPAAAGAALPHPNPLPLGEGTNPTAKGSTAPSPISYLPSPLFAAARTALADPSAHVQRAAAAKRGDGR